MHNAAFTAIGENAVYLPFAISPTRLREAVQSIRTLGLLGVNVTIPYKEKVIPYLDKIDPLAKKIGSVNTIVNRKGTLIGYNTDGKGFLQDLKEHGVDPSRKTAIVVGAGGAGRAIAATLSWAGAKAVYITNRTSARARSLSKKIPRAQFISFNKWRAAVPSVDIIINTTSIGMHANDPSIISASEMNKNLFVYDIIYNRRTALLDEARKAGAKNGGGLGMLLYQGALAFSLWTEQPAPVAIMKKTLSDELKKQH
jgi:shikimate dehydrogenase